jgi:uncharacterized membrane protein
MVELAQPQIEALSALAFGFALAGLVASAFQLLTDRPVSFRLLNGGSWRALASVPLLVIAAPFVILRNTIRGRTIEGRPLFFIWAATVIACGWSLASGKVMLDLVSRLAG